MNLFIYDQTFEGLITSIHDAIELKVKPDKISSTKLFQNDLFAAKHEVITNKDKFNNIWKTIKEKTNAQNCDRIFKAFLSELPDIEMFIYDYIKLILDTPYNVEVDFSQDSVIKINNVQRKVSREAERAIMFMRFQKSVDDIFYASFDPKYNIIPLTINHFKKRFADQKWIIFDTRRKYGYYYDLEDVREITIGQQKVDNVTGKINKEAMHLGEKMFQKLWKGYFDAINIGERKNLKVHMQFLPKRFWKFLPEKDFNNSSINIR